MTLKQFNTEVNRICAQSFRLPSRKRKNFIEAELEKMPFEGREAALSLIAATVDSMSDTRKLATWEKVTMVASGGGFLLLLMIVAVAIPAPAPFQVLIFRVVLAIAAAAFAYAIPGFLDISAKGRGFAIRAGGALAVFFLLVYYTPDLLQKAGVETRRQDSKSANDTASVPRVRP